MLIVTSRSSTLGDPTEAELAERPGVNRGKPGRRAAGIAERRARDNPDAEHQ
jgi:hypothetical protein